MLSTPTPCLTMNLRFLHWESSLLPKRVSLRSMIAVAFSGYVFLEGSVGRMAVMSGEFWSALIASGW